MSNLDKPEIAGLLGTDGRTARDDRIDPAVSDPASIGLDIDPRAEDAAGLSGSRAGHGGVASTLSKLSDADRAQLTELSKQRQYAHMEKVEELLLSGKSIQEADKLAYQMVPNDGPIGHSQRHAQMQQQRQQPRM